MWECQYYLCRAVFPVIPVHLYHERGLMAIVAEEENPYLPGSSELPDTTPEQDIKEITQRYTHRMLFEAPSRSRIRHNP
jgi:hypothetical protein